MRHPLKREERVSSGSSLCIEALGSQAMTGRHRTCGRSKALGCLVICSLSLSVDASLSPYRQGPQKANRPHLTLLLSESGVRWSPPPSTSRFRTFSGPLLQGARGARILKFWMQIPPSKGSSVCMYRGEFFSTFYPKGDYRNKGNKSSVYYVYPEQNDSAHTFLLSSKGHAAPSLILFQM